MFHQLSLAVVIFALGIKGTNSAGCIWKDAVSINGYCFKYVVDPKPWQEAQAYCELLPGGGTLAQFTADFDIPNLLPSTYGFTSEFWIGATDIKTEGTFRWPDGTPANLGGLWSKKEPDNYKNEDCAEIRPYGGVNDRQCSTVLPFICMDKPICPWKDAIFSNGDCFLFVREGKTWQEAQAYCESLPGEGIFAQVTSKSTLAQLKPSKFGIKSEVWIGASDLKTEGIWTWSDGTIANLRSLWGSGQPDNSDGTEDCVEMRPNGDGVNDLACNKVLPFLCMQKPVSADPCQLWPGAKYHDGRCFKYISEHRSWADSLAYCKSLPGGGTLASVRSDAERQIIAPERNGLNQKAWLGVNDIDVEGKYVWANKEPANISFLWAPGEPNDYYDEDCASFNPNGFIKDSECDELQASVCMLVLK